MSIRVNHGGTVKAGVPRCRTAAGVVTPLSVWANLGGVVKKVWPNGPTGATASGGVSYDPGLLNYRGSCAATVTGGRAPYTWDWTLPSWVEVIGQSQNNRILDLQANSVFPSDNACSCTVTDADGYSITAHGSISVDGD
jgi:hypothetical protein